MVDPRSIAVEVAALEAVLALRLARSRLTVLVDTGASNEAKGEVVQDAADRLAKAAGDHSCPIALSTLLLDWRDRLGSYCLTARAFAEADLAPSLIDQLVRRGLDEAIDEAAARLGALSPARDERVATAR